MASAANGWGGRNDWDELACVYYAVVDGESAEDVRELIEEYAQKGEEWREAVVNCTLVDDTALSVAHWDLQREDLVAVLHEAGGRDARGRCHPLALALHYGLTDTLRALLESGRCDADEDLWYERGRSLVGRGFCRCCPVHLAVLPPRRLDRDPTPPPRLDALEVLVREFGADVNAVDAEGLTPFEWLQFVAPDRRVPALRALAAVGADVNVCDGGGWTALFMAVADRDVDLVQALLAVGASADRFDSDGLSPLLIACETYSAVGPLVSALLRASSRETRRAVDRDGRSAVDRLIESGHFDKPWFSEVVSELLASGAPVLPRHARRVLPIAARLAEKRAAEAAKRNRSGAMQWRAHEDLFKLAQDFQELREAEEAVEAKERRVAELQEELRRRGDGGDREDDDDEGAK